MTDELDGVVIEEQIEFTLGELSHACSVHAEWIILLVEEGILEPVAGTDTADWRFTGTSLQRVRITQHLQRDLGINLAGAALALDLLDELESLRVRMAALGL